MHGKKVEVRLREVQEAYQAPTAAEKLERGPLEYAAVWKAAQRLVDRPVKFGSISAQSLSSMLWNQAYSSDRELIMDLASILNAELKELVAAGSFVGPGGCRRCVGGSLRTPRTP